MTKYVSGIVQRASPNVGEGRIRPAGRSLGTPALDDMKSYQPTLKKFFKQYFIQLIMYFD